MTKIVLTGGGYGGKTTFSRALSARSLNCLCIPELADVGFATGVRAQEKRFELLVYQLQKAVEDAITCVAHEDEFLLCHRGTLDALAFWRRKGWHEREFWSETHTTLRDELERYDGVLHLQTAAVGAEQVYISNTEQKPVESIELATELDRLCGELWRQHPRYHFIPNTPGGWEQKRNEAEYALNHVLQSVGTTFSARRITPTLRDRH